MQASQARIGPAVVPVLSPQVGSPPYHALPRVSGGSPHGGTAT
jgi:hypothetical protein